MQQVILSTVIQMQQRDVTPYFAYGLGGAFILLCTLAVVCSHELNGGSKKFRIVALFLGTFLASYAVSSWWKMKDYTCHYVTQDIHGTMQQATFKADKPCVPVGVKTYMPVK